MLDRVWPPRKRDLPDKSSALALEGARNWVGLRRRHASATFNFRGAGWHSLSSDPRSSISGETAAGPLQRAASVRLLKAGGHGDTAALQRGQELT